MAKSSHSMQRQRGQQGPMRPACARLRVTTAETLTVDAGAPDWTAAASLLLVGIDQEFMDDHSDITVASEILTLGPGIWHVHFAPLLRVGTVAAAPEVSIAITSATGATEYTTLERATSLTTDDNVDQQLSIDAFFHITVDTVIELRAVTTVATVTITDEEYIGYVTKIGNVNET